MTGEKGLVVENMDGVAVVLVHRSPSCGSCGAGCAHGSGDQKHLMRVVAQNPVDAKAGDTVELMLSPEKFLSLSAITYLMPLVFLFLGAFFGPSIAQRLGLGFDKDLASAVFAFAFLVFSFIGLWLYMKRYKPGGKISPVIVKVLPMLNLDLDKKEDQTE